MTYLVDTDLMEALSEARHNANRNNWEDLLVDLVEQPMMPAVIRDALDNVETLANFRDVCAVAEALMLKVNG